MREFFLAHVADALQMLQEDRPEAAPREVEQETAL